MKEEKLKRIFAKVFELPVKAVTDDLAYQQSPRWDSLGHMALVAALDTEFDIMLDTDDIIDMSSYQKTKEILQKYDIRFTA